MRVFLSHKMTGLTSKEVFKIRSEAKKYLTNKYGSNIEVIDNYHHYDAPENAGRLWHLGRSIMMLDKADAVYFVPGHWKNAKGCWVERVIVNIYGLKVLK